MSEENTAAVSPQETQGTEPAVSGEMPPEERHVQAARRRAAEERAREMAKSVREEQLRTDVLEHPLVKEAMTLLEETRFRKDLDRVREAYPGLTAKNPVEVGEIYCRLMAGGLVDPVVAYEAQVAADRRKNPTPADMAGAKSAGTGTPFFSSRELDRLTEADLKDPGIFRKALASLSRIK